MNNEKIGGDYKNNKKEKPEWQVERERELNRKIGGVAMGGAMAAVLVAMVLAHSAKTSEIMNNEERAKNVKRIEEVKGIAFYDGANARKEPFVGTIESNQLASVGEEGKVVVVPYDGDAYYYNNESDPNGDWYGFDASQLSEALLENGCISVIDANSLDSDEEYGDGAVWLNGSNVSVIKADETS